MVATDHYPVQIQAINDPNVIMSSDHQQIEQIQYTLYLFTLLTST